MVNLNPLLSETEKERRAYFDKDVVARTIYGEGRGQSFEGQVAIGFVIFNRAKERKQSVREVCLAPRQFSCWNLGDINRKIIETITLQSKGFTRAYGIACLIMTEDLNDPTFNPEIGRGANHYYNPDIVHPNWAKNMKVLKTIDDHIFLTDRS